MNVRATAIAAGAAFALAALGAGPAFADNHSTVAPLSQGPRYIQNGPRYLMDGNFQHLVPQSLVDGQSEHLAPRSQVDVQFEHMDPQQ